MSEKGRRCAAGPRVSAGGVSFSGGRGAGEPVQPNQRERGRKPEQAQRGGGEREQATIWDSNVVDGATNDRDAAH